MCGFNFEKAYGDYAKGFIHIHHIVPVSEFDDEIEGKAFSNSLELRKFLDRREKFRPVIRKDK